MSKLFSLVVEVINGEIQEFPVTMEFPCELLVPVGETVIRDYDSSVNFVIAKRVFLVRYGNSVFGTTTFKNLAGFLQYMNAICHCCTECGSYVLTANGCFLTINGCDIVIQPCRGIQLMANGCNLTINGCTINLN